MSTHVIILAQGSQKRLPELTVAKQMLPLPACGNTPILYRTIRQLFQLLDVQSVLSPRPGAWPSAIPSLRDMPLIRVVTWFPLVEQVIRDGIEVGNRTIFHPSMTMLADPGNSSLRGVSRYLSSPETSEIVNAREYDRTVVLLGDVVYSWACLRAILTGTHWRMGFVGTSDLSRDGGELWGLSWEKTAEEPMLHSLNDALAAHPKFTEYQPGQMRRWLWAFEGFMHRELGQAVEPRNWYVPIDDYTRDIDLPEHVKQLGALSEHAAADDLANGVTW